MSIPVNDTIIKVDGLGKKYVIAHGGSAAQTTLRDALSRTASGMFKKKKPLPAKEDFWALKNISFTVRRGEAVGIIGHNGAGKSTLLKILSRIIEPTEGQIEICGRIASLLEVGTGFHPELTGRENIFLNGAILGMNQAEIRKKFDEIVDFAGTEKFLDTPVKKYSSGMYVRLAFAVAAHLEPEILIVDEVLAVGDAEFQKKCLGKMSEVSKKEGRTVLFVSHNMGAVNALCDKAIILSEGSILSQGTPQDCIREYLSAGSRQKHQLHYVTEDIPVSPAYIKEVKLEGTKFGGDIFDVHATLRLHVRVVVREQISGTTPYFDLKCNGEVLYRSFASDCQEQLLDGIGPGEYDFTCDLHSPLKKNYYSIDVKLIKITDSFYHQVSDAICFEVDELQKDLLFKSYSHKRPGIVGFNKPWDIETVR